MLASLHQDGVCPHVVGARRGIGIREVPANAALITEQGSALAVHRNVEVLEPRADTAGNIETKLVLAVSRKAVHGDNPATRAVRRTLHVIPRVLRAEGRRAVGRLRDRGVPVAHGDSADCCRGVQVGLEQRGRECLRVGDVVEIRALGIERQVVASVDLHAQEVANGMFVLRPVQPLKGARPGVWPAGVVHDLFKRFNEGRKRIGRRPTRARRRHHLRTQFPDDLLRRVHPSRRGIHVVALQREVPLHLRRAVARHAVPLNDGRESACGDASRSRDRARLRPHHFIRHAAACSRSGAEGECNGSQGNCRGGNLHGLTLFRGTHNRTIEECTLLQYRAFSGLGQDGPVGLEAWGRWAPGPSGRPCSSGSGGHARFIAAQVESRTREPPLPAPRRPCRRTAC